jgi:uncharacterized repeat protein (TIGR03803 family)
MRKFGRSTMVCIVLVFCAATAIAAAAPTFTTLANFDLKDGLGPGYLVQGTDGSFYGTTGGVYTRYWGTVFKITAGGTLTTLHDFDRAEAYPGGRLVQATDGDFYGTTLAGGANSEGMVFKMTAGGRLTTFYSFRCQTQCGEGVDGEGAAPGSLVQAADGDFYGTTESGGADRGYGTVFKITAAGTLTTLYSFCSQTNCNDGEGASALVQATDGDFYATTSFGGADNFGTVFKITPTGMLTTLYSFCSQPNCKDGANPYAGLVQATDGNFYGTTNTGGENGYGTVFKITPTGMLTTLYNFCSQPNCTDGEAPGFGLLIQATDGNFYGTARLGGANGDGTVFKITPGGTLTTLHNFDGTDGFYPEALVQATNGTFYGTTNEGGDLNCDSGYGSGCGSVFSLSIGLGPFVKTEPTSGMVGADVIILGNNLTDTTGVTFNGTAATFTVVSSSEITATVPSGATTGKVEVTTPSGTLTSNVNFQISVYQR